MPQVALNLDFSAQLMRNIVLEQLALEEDLERDYKLGFLLSGQVHMAELTSTERSPNLKVVDRPLCLIKLSDFGSRNCCWVSSRGRYALRGRLRERES